MFFVLLLPHLEHRDESEADHRLGIPQLTFTEVDTRLLLVPGNQLVFCGNTWYIWLCEEREGGREGKQRRRGERGGEGEKKEWERKGGRGVEEWTR